MLDWIGDDVRATMEEEYKHLHAHPELSMQEHNTAAFVESKLTDLGIEHFRCGGTGVVGILRNGDGPVVAFRADYDGLPIAEDTGLDYASTDTGHLADGTEVPLMHGCGHDTHAAVLLAMARVLLARRSDWSGTLVFIFQPGEETAAGAAAMVADGLWDKAPRPEVVYGQHVWPPWPARCRCRSARPWRCATRGRSPCAASRPTARSRRSRSTRSSSAPTS